MMRLSCPRFNSGTITFLNLLIISFLSIITLILVVPILRYITKDNFNGSGYGFNNKFSEKTSIIPFNNITRSTDFKLFSLLSQILWKAEAEKPSLVALKILITFNFFKFKQSCKY